MSRTVADLKLGESGYISGFASDDNVLKLLEMGCLPGSEVKLKFNAPFKGPIYISVAGNEMAIRRGVAKNILLLPKE
ncbi:MAG: ferrous iron transport protein A [Flavobacteriales bacterium]|nr:ferrous iron transport protein A [Flavobacteriales bacterium]